MTIEMIVSIGVLAALQIADVYSTYLVLSKGGVEANPLMKWVLDRFGFWGLSLCKVGFIAFVIYQCLVGLIPLWTLWVISAGYIWVVKSNMGVYKRIK